ECDLDLLGYVACDSATGHAYAGPLGDGSHTFTVRVTDGAGNSGTDSFTWTIDTADPSVTITTVTDPVNAANKTSVGASGTVEAGATVAVTVTDGTTTVGPFNATVVSTSWSITGINVTTLADGTVTYKATATDAATNSAFATKTASKDTLAPAAPSITSSSPASPANDNSPVLIGSAEPGSTVKIYTSSTCTTGLQVSGSAAAFASPGLTVTVADNSSTTFYATATDAAGNTSLCSSGFTYSEVTASSTYTFVGFFAPVDNPNVVNFAKAGQSIPVKWRITDAYGNPVSDPSSFVGLTSNTANCNAWTTSGTDAIETYAGSSGLQYLGNGYWQFNWKTPTTYANTCRVMKVTLSDGTTHTADFKFTK
ncbi:MAG TPA: PxKF domain-containing protein, partial [Candidatus Eisenbacteria bacterium]|nr:PxKF domain-containing protein [Candidatus Eisenbacteria bacterium]